MVGHFQLEGRPTGEVDVLPQPEDAHRHGHRPLPPEVDVGWTWDDGMVLGWKGSRSYSDSPWVLEDLPTFTPDENGPVL